MDYEVAKKAGISPILNTGMQIILSLNNVFFFIFSSGAFSSSKLSLAARYKRSPYITIPSLKEQNNPGGQSNT